MDNPIFILGAPRSGTTLALHLITAHPDIASVRAESRFFIHYHEKYGDLRNDSNFEHLFDKFSQTSFFRRTNLNSRQIFRLMYNLNRSYGTFIDTILSEFAQKQGAIRWAEKTPTHIFYIDRILNEFPTAKFIHVVRDARDVVASTLKLARDNPELWSRPGNSDNDNIVEFTLRWLKSINFGEKKKLELGSKVIMEVRFEDLIRFTEKYLKVISDFLKLPLPLSFRMIENSPNTSSFWNANTAFSALYRGLSEDPIGRYMNYLSQGEIKLVELLTGRILTKYGYRTKRTILTPSLLASLSKYSIRNRRQGLQCLKVILKPN